MGKDESSCRFPSLPWEPCDKGRAQKSWPGRTLSVSSQKPSPMLTFRPLIQISHELEVSLQLKRQVLDACRGRRRHGAVRFNAGTKVTADHSTYTSPATPSTPSCCTWAHLCYQLALLLPPIPQPQRSLSSTCKVLCITNNKCFYNPARATWSWESINSQHTALLAPWPSPDAALTKLIKTILIFHGCLIKQRAPITALTSSPSLIAATSIPDRKKNNLVQV